MASPLILVVVIFLTVAGIAGLVIYLLSPAREKLLNDDPAVNDSRISGQWAGGQGAGGDDTPTHHLSPPHDNVIHHDFGGHSGGHSG